MSQCEVCGTWTRWADLRREWVLLPSETRPALRLCGRCLEDGMEYARSFGELHDVSVSAARLGRWFERQRQLRQEGMAR